MKSIENWCISVSVVSVITGIITTLLPKSALKNTYFILTGIVTLYVCIQPFTDWREFQVDFEKILSYREQNNSSDVDYNSSILYAAEQTYKKYIDSKLKEMSQKAECTCECEYANEKLYITKITIYGNISDESQEKFINEIKDIIQETTVVEFRGDDNATG